MEIRPRPAPRKGRKQLRNPNPQVTARLLEAAAELLRHETFSRLRVEEVARQAELSVGTFYLYFDGKDDLFVQLVVEFTGRLRQRLVAAYQGPGDFWVRMQEALVAYLDFVEENEPGFLYFRDGGTIDTTVGHLSSWALDRHVEDLLPLIDEAMEAGQLRRDDPTLTAQAILGTVQHLAGFWLTHRQTWSRDELRRFLGRLLASGLSTLPHEGPDRGGGGGTE